MKDEKLIYAVRNIDDDLICEAMKRRSADTKPVDEAVRAVYFSGKRKGQILKYSAAASALLAVTGGTILIVQYQDGIKNQLGFPGYTNEGEGQTEGEASTAVTEVSPLSSTAAVTEPAEEVKKVVPLKFVAPDTGDEINIDSNSGSYIFSSMIGIYVDSFPNISLPENSEEYFTEMTTKELLDYYGLDIIGVNNIGDWLDSNKMTEVTDENTHHGIYKLPDGSIYDINSFTFELTEKSADYANKFTITMGKKTRFGQEFDKYFKSVGSVRGSNHSTPGGSAFYNEEKDIIFRIYYNYYVMTIMSSGKPAEVTRSFFTDDPDLKNRYGKQSEKGIDMIVYTDYMLFKDHTGNRYIDDKADLWYNKESNCYFNEETYEWIPAEEWELE